jgi:hypothetical protein
MKKIGAPDPDILRVLNDPARDYGELLAALLAVCKYTHQAYLRPTVRLMREYTHGIYDLPIISITITVGLIGGKNAVSALLAFAEWNERSNAPTKEEIHEAIARGLRFAKSEKALPMLLRMLHFPYSQGSAEDTIGVIAPFVALPAEGLPKEYRPRKLSQSRARRWLKENGIAVSASGTFAIKRAATSYVMNHEHRYTPGNTYEAPLFSCNVQRDCAPGLHVATDAWLHREYRSEVPYIVVRAHISDLLIPADSNGKARVRKFTVIAENVFLYPVGQGGQ